LKISISLTTVSAPGVGLDLGVGSGSAADDGLKAITFGAKCVNAPFVRSGL
jgi:hypothetical protein